MSEDQINIKLVQLVEKYPIIYDNSLPGHSNKNELDRVWSEVSKEVNLNVATCKDKWRNCRNCWSRYLRQTPASGSAATTTKKPYYLADYLAFLTPFTKSKRQTGNLKNPKVAEQPVTGEEPSSPPIIADSSEEESTQEVMEPPHRESRRGTKRGSNLNVDEIFSSYPQMKTKRTAEVESENPDALFFKSLLPDVAKLSPADKSALKLSVHQKLHDMLYRSPTNVHK